VKRGHLFLNNRRIQFRGASIHEDMPGSGAALTAADMDRIVELARRHSLALVEDCAHAHGQRWRDRGAGSFGEFGSFSHQSTKLLTAGEGGSLLTDDEQLARRAHSLIDCGRAKDPEEKEFTFGANYRLGELHAALLLRALERLPAQQAQRAEAEARILARHLPKHIAGAPTVIIQNTPGAGPIPKPATHSRARTSQPRWAFRSWHKRRRVRARS
jgi:hypothetical protein